jgi:hypothetical protein
MPADGFLRVRAGGLENVGNPAHGCLIPWSKALIRNETGVAVGVSRVSRVARKQAEGAVAGVPDQVARHGIGARDMRPACRKENCRTGEIK